MPGACACVSGAAFFEPLPCCLLEALLAALPLLFCAEALALLDCLGWAVLAVLTELCHASWFATNSVNLHMHGNVCAQATRWENNDDAEHLCKV